MLLDNIYSNRLCYSTMYMSVATGKNISIYILVRLSLEYYVLLRRWEINVRASLEGDVQNILFTLGQSYIYHVLQTLTLYCGTHNWMCVHKMLNHGLNHGFFDSLFKLIHCHKHWNVCVSLFWFHIWILDQF